MGKLGKKARKFAKKNLQSVLRNKRKTNALFKKRYASKGKHDTPKDQVESTVDPLNGRNPEDEDTKDATLDAIFSEDDTDLDGDDASESDGFLSEDSSCPQAADSDGESILEGNSSCMQNSKIHVDLTEQKKKLDSLKTKDPDFVKFLESYNKGLGAFKNEDMFSDEDEPNEPNMQSMDDDVSFKNKKKVLTSSVINSWIHLVTEKHSESALTSLLNGYRAACHYGTVTAKSPNASSFYVIQDSEAFNDILIFILREADNIFRGLLKISPSNCKKEAILELKNSSKWKNVKPLLKSYLRSTLFLLNEVTDSGILAFSLTRLRVSVIFFAAFPSLLRRLIKITVQLWTTGTGDLSSCSFRIIRDIAVVFSSDCFDTCLMKTYKAYIAQCKFVEPVNIEHLQFLRNSVVELCSLDVQKASAKANLSIRQLAKIFQQGIRTKEKEAIKKICSWQYVNCIDLWVVFISANVQDYDLQSLVYMIIQIINGVACLFPGPRYLPLRRRCIEWLNSLSASSGVFIPVVSLTLDILEYKTGKEGGKSGKGFNFSSVLKLPKHLLKSRDLQEECVFSTIELLSVHFARWSYHISFPEVATIPLIRLKKFHEATTVESIRRVVKRLIDQVELNVEFVQKKRDEVAFSPNDPQSVESFLQIERGTSKAPFTQYYKSVAEKAASRNLLMKEKTSSLEKKTLKRKTGGVVKKADDASGNGKRDSVGNGVSVNGRDKIKGKKRRT